MGQGSIELQAHNLYRIQENLDRLKGLTIERAFYTSEGDRHLMLQLSDGSALQVLSSDGKGYGVLFRMDMDAEDPEPDFIAGQLAVELSNGRS